MVGGNNLFTAVGFAAALMGLSATVGTASAHEPSADAWQKYFAHIGYSAVPYDANGVSSTPYFAIPDANIRLDTSYTAYFDAGYYFTPNFAVALSAGYPPTVTAWGTGVFAPYALGKVTGGMVELNAQYHFTNFGAFQPYVGGGPVYFHVFDTKDGALAQFGVRDSWGFNVQIGADWMITKNVGVFFDVKKVFLSTTATGATYFGSPVDSILPVNTDVRLDPTIISAGLTLRY
jgi:outer membrane protein